MASECLHTVRTDPRMVGFVGNRAIGEKSFAADFARLEPQPLFFGTSYDNLQDRDMGGCPAAQYRPRSHRGRVKSHSSRSRPSRTTPASQACAVAAAVLATVIHEEPENTQCACGCQLQHIGEDICEKLDYTPGVFTVEQYVRGKWACRKCQTDPGTGACPSDRQRHTDSGPTGACDGGEIR